MRRGLGHVDGVSRLRHATHQAAARGQAAVAHGLLVQAVAGHQYHGAIGCGNVQATDIDRDRAVDRFHDQLYLVFGLVRLGGGLHNAGQFLQRIHRLVFRCPGGGE